MELFQALVLTSGVQCPAPLGGAAPHDAPDHHAVALVPHGGAQRLVVLRDAHNARVRHRGRARRAPARALLGPGDRALNKGLTKFREDFIITEKAPTRAFSWLKAASTAFTFQTLC